MKSIKMLPLVGSFAEDKDVAKRIRLEEIIPTLEKGDEVTLDFSGVDSATQSFMHALISDLFRKYGIEILDRLYFKNCSEIVQKIISFVCEYMQESD